MPNQFGLKQADVMVKGFNVSHKNKSFEVLSDVVNEHDSSVKYVCLMAVAYDINDKELAPNQRSGFKVKVGTFTR